MPDYHTSKKILFIANGIVGRTPGMSGGEMRFIEIAKWWQSQKHKIYILSTDSGCQLCKKYNIHATYYKSIATPIASRFVFVINTLISPFLVIPALSFKKGIIYSCNDMFLDVLPGFILKILYGKNITWVAVVHWLPPFPPWKRKESTVINSILFYINQRLSLFLANHFANHIFPVSESTHTQLTQANINPAKIFTVQCGVNYKEIQLIKSKKNIKKYDAVFMKRFQTVKGVIDTIHIWKEIVKIKPQAQLLMIGEGPEADNVLQLIAKYKLQKNITLTGVIYDFRQKFNYLFESKIFILPSYEENWAIVIGEAMASGLPVVAYKLPELDSAWKDNYISSPLGDIKQFSKNIINLLNNSKKYHEMSTKSKKYVQQFDWSNIAKSEYKVLTNTL